jgi:hypothetical protein
MFIGLLGRPKHLETPDVFRITSTNGSQSALLVITYGSVQTSMSVYFADDDLFYTTTVTMKNVGESEIEDLACE